MNLPIYTAVGFLRGEIGASDVISRDMKNKILFMKHALTEDRNQLLKSIMTHNISLNDTIWVKKTIQYLQEVELNVKDVCDMSIQMIKNKINEKDSDKWRNDIIGKSSLYLYRELKNNINEEKWFRNSYKHSIMMNARANTLKLGWRSYFHDNNSLCKLCNEQVETLEHFLIDCQRIQYIRQKYSLLQRPHIENKKDIMRTLLLFDEVIDDYETPINALYEMWKEREKLLAES